MENLTDILNFSLWFLNGTFILTLLFLCPFFLIGNTRALAMQNYNILSFFKSWFPTDFIFFNKKIQKISLKTYLYSFSTALLITPILVWGLVFGLAQLAIKEPELRIININEIYYHFIIMGLLMLFSIVFFWVSSVIILRKNLASQISDEELLEKFNNFRNEWLLKNGHEKVYFEVKWPKKYDRRSLIGFRFGPMFGINFKQQRKLKKLKWVRKTHPNNYEYYYIQSFRYYLGFMSNLINLMYLAPEYRGQAFSEKDGHLLHIEELKFAVIQNYLTALDEFWTVDQKEDKKMSLI